MSDEYDILIELSADDMKKAADEREHRDAEITRLRERLAEADEANRRVSDENEKLREVLEGMINLAEAANVMDDPAYDAARKALESGDE